VITPNASTPTMSSRATRTAVSAPLSPKANVPTRSNTSNNGGPLTGGVYRSIVPLRSEAQAGQFTRRFIATRRWDRISIHVIIVVPFIA
jgi:hypothetical protein